MTSQPSLPYVEAGMIWDGVTEYVDFYPPGISTIFLLRMVGDGSRRFTGTLGTAQPMHEMRRLSTQPDAWESIGVTFENAAILLHYNPDSAYLDYDGDMSAIPVNQIPA